MPTTRTFSLSQVILIVALAMALVFGGFLLGVSSSANASGTPKTFYACLNKGSLSKVSTKTHACTGTGNKLISWSQTGPAGTTGAQGAGMDYRSGFVTTQSGAASVTFTTAASDANFTVVLTPQGATPATCTVQNKSTSGFDIYCQKLISIPQIADFYIPNLDPVSLMGSSYSGHTDSFLVSTPSAFDGDVAWMVVSSKNS